MLIKGSIIRRPVSGTRYVIFDQDGHPHRGVFEVNAVHHNKMSQEQLLEYAALAESASPHPISKSLSGPMDRRDRPQQGHGHPGDQRKRRHGQSRWLFGGRRQ